MIGTIVAAWKEQFGFHKFIQLAIIASSSEVLLARFKNSIVPWILQGYGTMEFLNFARSTSLCSKTSGWVFLSFQVSDACQAGAKRFGSERRQVESRSEQELPGNRPPTGGLQLSLNPRRFPDHASEPSQQTRADNLIVYFCVQMLIHWHRNLNFNTIKMCVVAACKWKNILSFKIKRIRSGQFLYTPPYDALIRCPISQ